jgi:pimeloyl-ACP methyl ester carboxylesterase
MTPMPVSSSASGVLLVHGAWLGPGCWEPVVDLLESRGITVATPRLHRGSLQADTAAACEALDDLGEAPVVACGHSYGGTVITGLPAERLGHLVFLAAVMPDETETSLGLLDSEQPNYLMPAVRATDDPETTVIDPDLAPAAFLSQMDRARAMAYLHDALVPQRMTAGHESPKSVAWRTTPSSYVVCADDHAVNPDLQHRLAVTRATQTVTWDSDHLGFVERPERLADLLATLASSYAARA